MKNIACKACEPEDKGCNTCSGYKFVLVERTCDTCGESYLVRPGAMTIYDGKKYTSADGLTITHSVHSLSTCSRCPPNITERKR